MSLLDQNIITQLKAYFDKIEGTVEINAFLDESDKGKELDNFLSEVDAISNKVNVVKYNFDENDDVKAKQNEFDITRPVSFALSKAGKSVGINFYGIPGGHEFNSFVLAILGIVGIGKKLEDDQLLKVQGVKEKTLIETFVSLSCTHCPDVIQALNMISLANDNITTAMIDSAVFNSEAKEKDIQAVPVVFINGKQSSVGAKTLQELINIVAGN